MRLASLIIGLTMTCGVSMAQADSVIRPQEWSSYVENYVGSDGRVIDTANNAISHSESQGYGLLLSVLADDRASFERIWSFTRTELLVRQDGLAAWLWDPAKTPHIADANNATDGDILIAYALALAERAWGDAGYADTARRMISTIGKTMVVDVAGMPAILPGEHGFEDRPDGKGPILNPSYWVFEALPVFAELDNETDWAAVAETGIELVRRARITKSAIPPDWLVLDEQGQVRPAPDFPAEFGYNGIRIPLYLIRAERNLALLDPFRHHTNADGMFKVDAVTGANIEPITEPGYQLIAAAMDCVADNSVVPETLATMSATSYYAATLQLLMLDHLRRNRPGCLPEAGQ